MKDAITAGISFIVAIIILVAIVLIVTANTAGATWKPEYKNNPQAVQDWFQAAKPPLTGAARLGISLCCNDAERLMTKFVPSRNGDWSFYPDPACTHAGCKLLPIPNDVVHDDTVHAIDPKDDALPEFEAMRREGVLFIWQGKPSCFWPPRSGI
jgi:hypothetical protein